jgi:hypothetical protein
VSQYLEQFRRPVFRVRDWQRIYEKSDAKRTSADRPLDWVAVPTKHDGTGYKRLMRSRKWNGMLIHSAFILIIQVAAKMPERGTLRNHDGAINALDLADKTDGDADVFSEALEVLSNPELGIRWLEVSEDTSEYPSVGAPTRRDTTRHDERDKTEHTPQPPKGGVGEALAVTAETRPPKSPSPKRDRGEDFTPGFMRFWSAYPPCERKTGKSNAARSWKRRKLEHITEQVIDALERCKVSRQWTKDGGEFIPGPVSWLNKASWESDPADLIPAASNGNGNGCDWRYDITPPSADQINALAGTEDNS